MYKAVRVEEMFVITDETNTIQKVDGKFMWHSLGGLLQAADVSGLNVERVTVAVPGDWYDRVEEVPDAHI